MPRYQITDSQSGTTLVVEGDSPPTEAEAEELFAQAIPQRQEANRAASRVAPSAYGVGTMPVDNAQVAEMTKTTARYGPAIVAGLATGGAGLAPALAATAGAGALGESAAQRMEVAEGYRAEPSLRDVVAAGVTSMMGTPLRVGSGLARAGVNVAANLAAGEAGQAIQEGGWQAPQSALDLAARAVLPALAGVASLPGERAGKIAAVRAEADKLSQTRELPVGRGVLVSEVLDKKGLPELEQKLFRAGFQKLLETADDMTVGMSDQLQSLFARTGLIDEQIAADLVPYMDRLKQAEQAHMSALQASDAAKARLADLEAKGLAPEVVQKAREEATFAAAKEVELRDIRKGAVEAILGERVPTLSQASQATRLESISGQVKVLDDAYANARNKLYGEKVGIGLNEPVVSRADFDAALVKARGANGSKLAGNSAYERVKAQAEKVFAGRPELTREDFLNFRDRLAKDLADESEFADSANKIAAEAYGALTHASDTFIRRIDPVKADALQRANMVMAEVYGSRAADAIEKLRAGDIDVFTDTVIKQGRSTVDAEGRAKSIWSELTAYAKAGTRLAAQAGDSQANAAVEAFYRKLGKGMKDSLAVRALDPATSATQPVVDMNKFTSDLQALQNGGFPLRYLGIDKPAHVQAARAMAERLQGGVMTTQQLDEFLDNAATLGVKRAGAKLEIEKLAQQYYATKMRNPLADQKKLVEQITQLSGSLKATEEALAAAKADPLVQLMSETGLGLSKDPINNGQWISRMVVAGPELARNVVQALEAKGMNDTLTKIRMATVAHVFNGFMEADVTRKTAGGFRVKLGDVKDYFGSARNYRRNETLRALLGKDQWNNLQSLKAPLEKAEATISRLKAKPYTSDIEDAAVVGAAAAKTFGGTVNLPILWVKGAVSAGMNLARQGRYKTLHMLYIDPLWSKQFERAGRNLERFLQNPSAAVAYRLANQEDDEAQAERAVR